MSFDFIMNPTPALNVGRKRDRSKDHLLPRSSGPPSTSGPGFRTGVESMKRNPKKKYR